MNASGCKTKFASTQIARRVRIIAQWQIHRAYANTRKGVIAMLKRANGRPVPNNPAKAYELGRLDGTKQCMDNVSCVLLDKCGFHVREETADEHDTRSLEYLQQCLVELVESKNNGYIKMADIEKALRGEYKMVNSAE
nr:MAG TPA: hypothetical protein [Caudoviricetes sp.]